MKFPMHKRNGRKSILVAEMLEKLENRMLIIADNAERLPPKITSLPTDSKRVLTGIFSSITCNVLVLKDNTECVSTTQNILGAELLTAAYVLISFLQTLWSVIITWLMGKNSLFNLFPGKTTVFTATYSYKKSFLNRLLIWR